MVLFLGTELVGCVISDRWVAEQQDRKLIRVTETCQLYQHITGRRCVPPCCLAELCLEARAFLLHKDAPGHHAPCLLTMVGQTPVASL